MTSIPENLNCTVVKKKRGELRWSELAFEDENGERCKPKFVIADVAVLSSNTSSNHSKPASYNLPLHNDDDTFHDSNGDFSLGGGGGEDESSMCFSTSRASTEHHRPQRRGSLGRFAERIGKRLVGEQPEEPIMHHEEMLHDSNGDFSVLSMEEEEESLCPSTTTRSSQEPRPQRRGSLGRFAGRVGKRLVGEHQEEPIMHHEELLHDSNGDFPMLSIEEKEEEESLCPASAVIRTSFEPRPQRRGSLGRFAGRVSKRLAGGGEQDDHTASTCGNSTVSDHHHQSTTDGVVVPPPPPPPTLIRADTPQLSNRFSFMSKQRGNQTHKKYLGHRESQWKQQISDERRGQVMSSLYTCMEADDDEEDLLSSILRQERPIRFSAANCAA